MSATARLERQAYAGLGIGPKEFISIVRFQTVLKALQKMRTNGSMMQVAYQAGYYDPAHFTREVKKYAGLTPYLDLPGTAFSIISICRIYTNPVVNRLLIFCSITN